MSQVVLKIRLKVKVKTLLTLILTRNKVARINNNLGNNIRDPDSKFILTAVFIMLWVGIRGAF